MADTPEAGMEFVAFLQANKVPEHLFDELVAKIENGAVGSDGLFQAVLNADGRGMLLAEADMDDGPAGGHIFIVPNVLAATRLQLHQRLEHDTEALQACATAIQLPEGGARMRDEVLREIWAWARPTALTGTPARQETVWTLESPESLWARHAESPNMAVVPLPEGLAAAIGGEAGAPHGAVMMWPLRQIRRGEEVTRDLLPGTRSLQRGVSLLALLGEPPRRWAHAEEYQGLKTAVAQAVASQPPPGVLQAPGRTAPSDQRPHLPHQPGEEVLSVWTDYPLVRENLKDDRFAFTDDRDAADIVFSVSPIRNFLSMPSGQLVNQFPYEACIIRKDLLPATLRRLHAAAREADPQQEAPPRDAAPASWQPPWFPPAYDLATEVQYFLRDHAEREAAGHDAHYVVKLAQGSRSTDLCLTDNKQLVVRAREAPGGDRVAQQYVADPLLFRGQKFDLRTYLVVRSFADGDAFLYSDWYGRLANKAYPAPADVARTETDAERHFTVAAYDANAAVSSAQVMVPKNEVIAELQSQGVDTDKLEDGLRHVAQQVVQAAQAQIGYWPRSRALYGLDILLARSGSGGGACSPQLLEVNFCPDFSSWLRVHASVTGVISDVFTAAFTQQPDPPGFWRLYPEEPEQPALQLSDVDNID